MAVIRVNDIVKITTPERFVRCGYPFDQRAATQHLIDHYSGDICSLIRDVDPNPLRDTYGTEKDFRDLCGRLARIVAHRDKFGGDQRSIYTDRDEQLTGLRCQVIGKKIHKTGQVAGRGEGAYLANGKTHVILTVSPIWHVDDYGTVTGRCKPFPSVFQIEVIHVEKEEPTL